jgi:hypothetical protein
MGWAFLPPLQRTLATGIETITRPTEFAHDLPAWRNPSFNAPLTHLVSDAAPSGVIDGGDGTGLPGASTSPRPELTLLPPPRPVAVQRSTPRAEPARFTSTPDAGMPVMQRSVVPDAPVAEAQADEALPEPENAQVGASEPVGTEVPVLPVTGTPESTAGPMGPSPISGGGPAMPLQRAVAPAAPAGTRPRLGLGAPLTAVPPTAVSTPVQRTAESTPRPLAPSDQAASVSRSLDQSSGATGPSGSPSAELSGPDSTPGSSVVPVEPAQAVSPVPLPLQRAVDAPVEVERAATSALDAAPEPTAPAASSTTASSTTASSVGASSVGASSAEPSPSSAPDQSPDDTSHEASGHAAYDAPLLSAQAPLAASAAGSTSGSATGPNPAPSQVTASTGGHPLVVARSMQAPGDVTPSLAQDAGPLPGHTESLQRQADAASPAGEAGTAPTLDGPGPGPGHQDTGLSDHGATSPGPQDAGLSDHGATSPDSPVGPEHRAPSPMGLPVVSRSVSALPAASTVLRSTPLPLAAGLATSIQRGSVLLGAGTPATSLVVRPTPVLGARPSGRTVPVQRVLVEPSAPAGSTPMRPSTPAVQRRAPAAAAPPREPLLRRLQRGLFGPDQTSGPGASSGIPGPAQTSAGDLGSAGDGAPADGVASLGSPSGLLPTSPAVRGAPSAGDSFESQVPDDHGSPDTASVGLTMPTVSRATALPGVPSAARAATGLALPAAHLARESAAAAPSMALPPALQRSVTTPDAPLDAPGAAPLPSLALASPPPVVQRDADASAPGPSNDGAQDHVQRAVDAGSWGSTEVSLSGPVVQTALEPPAAGSAAGPAAAAPGAGTPQSPEEIEALAQKLLKPMLRRIKGELLLDRERHGLRTDTW